MNAFHQWKTQCPKCGESDSMKVVGFTLQATGEFLVTSVPLEADGFEVSLPDNTKDCSTEGEKVKCYSCGAQFDLCDLTIDTFYKVDPKKLSVETRLANVKIAMSERSFFDLALQKQALQRAIVNAAPSDAGALTGIMHLIDSVQDDGVDSAGFPADVVFPISSEERGAVLKETEVKDLDI